MRKSPSSLQCYRFWPWAIAGRGEYPRRTGRNEKGLRDSPGNYGLSCSMNTSTNCKKTEERGERKKKGEKKVRIIKEEARDDTRIPFFKARTEMQTRVACGIEPNAHVMSSTSRWPRPKTAGYSFATCGLCVGECRVSCKALGT